MLADNSISGKCTLLLSGYIRGRSLSVNQLVIVWLQHITLRFKELSLTLDTVGSGSHNRCWRFSVIQD